MMRVTSKVNVQITKGTSNKDKLFFLDDQAAEQVSDAPTSESSSFVTLANAGVFDVPLAGIASCEGIFLQASGDFTLLLNGSFTVTVRRPLADGAGTTKAPFARVYLDVVVVSAQVTALEALDLSYAAWGDSPSPL